MADADEVELIKDAFAEVFGISAPKKFESRALGYAGFSDGRDGVQWNAGIDAQSSLAGLGRFRAFIGVNLEGLRYDDWPVSRLIRRELVEPLLPPMLMGLPRPQDIAVYWWRDAWQQQTRLNIAERMIGPTPVTLDRVREDPTTMWRRPLDEALQCLDASKGYKGRAKQTVTLGERRITDQQVSPHLAFRTPLWDHPPVTRAERIDKMRGGRALLEPLYDFVVSLSAADGGVPSGLTIGQRDLSNSIRPLDPGAADDVPFDPSSIEDAREAISRQIKVRRGQQEFREKMLAAYGRRCALTNCAIVDVLEAAHIHPYRGDETNHHANGLLLRTDLHTLFDCGLIAIDPDSLTVVVAPGIRTSSYGKLDGRSVRKREPDCGAPSADALRMKFDEFKRQHGI